MCRAGNGCKELIHVTSILYETDLSFFVQGFSRPFVIHFFFLEICLSGLFVFNNFFNIYKNILYALSTSAWTYSDVTYSIIMSFLIF